MNEYERELDKLRAMAAARDYTPEGDAAYYEQYQRTKAAYWRLCVEGVRA